MKKQLIIISIIVVIVGIFVSCSANSSSEDISTTAVTDSNGTLHYYEPVTGNKSTSVYAEIETQSNGKAVTEKNGTYVTNEHTTVLPIKDETIKPSSSTEPTTEKPSLSTTIHTANTPDADNVVEFEPAETTSEAKPTASTTTEKQTTSTTQKETQPATDKDGWIIKWY